MNRRIVTGKFRDTSSGEIIESFEEWGLIPINKISRKIILRAEDKLGNIPAPAGYLWVKKMVSHRPAGSSWVEVS